MDNQQDKRLAFEKFITKVIVQLAEVDVYEAVQIPVIPPCSGFPTPKESIILALEKGRVFSDCDLEKYFYEALHAAIEKILMENGNYKNIGV